MIKREKVCDTPIRERSTELKYRMIHEYSMKWQEIQRNLRDCTMEE